MHALQNAPMSIQSTADFSLESLNAEQRLAVETIDGPVLVLAGAGTGKTRVLTTRISYIIANGLAYPSQILSVTFTNKAAAEMKERVKKMVTGHSVDSMWIGTFHSLSVRILRRHAEAIYRTSDFTILDTDDQLRLIKQLLSAHNVCEKTWPPRAVLSTISRLKDRALHPGQVPNGEVPATILTIYEQYQDRLQVLNALDFGDLILKTVQLFQQNPDILRNYQAQFKYILVDEYQDTNIAQYLWLRLLAQGNNICCVGDDDQSIYGWRGADITNILKFEKDFPGATVIRLEKNYRSTPHILAAASALIANNRGRLGKTLWTDQNTGEPVKIIGAVDQGEEARLVGDEIEDLQRQGTALSDMAVLVRASFQTREFEDRFVTIGIPYRVIGGARFYERQEIRDALAYLRLIQQPNDSLAFERIINTPRRGIGPSTIQSLHHISRVEEIPMLIAARKIVSSGQASGKARTSMSAFINDIDRWRHQMSLYKAGDFARMVLDESGYTLMWKNDKTPEAPGRLENLKELVRAIDEYHSIGDFLEHVSLVMENQSENAESCITLMTLHSAKGLEFDAVFLAGWEEGLFPHAKSLKENGDAGLEEERRLAYVGLTRAKKRVFISYACNRRTHGYWQTSLPSRFLKELPTQNVKEQSQVGFINRDSNWEPHSMPQDLNKSAFAVGDRVFHIKFGYGFVIATDGDRIEVDFETGRKRVIGSFLETA
jgi:DNA helicase-2/ATP-dependent DNA helicase PcrA